MTQLEKYKMYHKYCGTKYAKPDGYNKYGAPKYIYTCAMLAIMNGENAVCSYDVCPEFGKHTEPKDEK